MWRRVLNVKVTIREIKEFSLRLFQDLRKNNFIPKNASDIGLYLGILGFILSIISIVLKRFGL